MGANILWQPVEGRSLSVGARSKFVNALRLPREFSAKDGDFLRGLAAGEPDFDEAVEELLEAIDNHGTVRVWAIY